MRSFLKEENSINSVIIDIISFGQKALLLKNNLQTIFNYLSNAVLCVWPTYILTFGTQSIFLDYIYYNDDYFDLTNHYWDK